MNRATALAAGLALVACRGPAATTAQLSPDEASTTWQRVEGWPRLAPGLELGQVSGVALDSRGHVWLFHRAGRAFDPASTAPIPAATVLELDGDTGALLSSWGQGSSWFLIPSLSIDATTCGSVMSAGTRCFSSRATGGCCSPSVSAGVRQ